MVQYNMDLKNEINELERAQTLLQDETVSNRKDILKVLNPLHIMSKVS